MANNFQANPLRITTAFQSLKSQVAATWGTLFSFRILKLYWQGPSTIGNQCVVTSASGTDIAVFICDAANKSQELDFTANPILAQDLSVPQIDSGTLFIYYAL